VSALATVADLEARLGKAVTDPIQAQAMLDDVSASVRSYTGQAFSRVITTDRLTVRRALVRLPQRPVNSVDAVALSDGTAVTFDWQTGAETVCVGGWESSCSRISAALVTYDHGYDTIPQDIVAVVCNVTNRGLGIDPTAGAIASRSISNYQETYGPVGAAGSTGLFTSEVQVLDRYRRFGTTAWVGV
jgi:hypothetical protein